MTYSKAQVDLLTGMILEKIENHEKYDNDFHYLLIAMCEMFDNWENFVKFDNENFA